jgi:hypothetical protein
MPLKLPFGGKFLRLAARIGGAAIGGPLALLIPEAVNLGLGALAAARGEPAPAPVQDTRASLKGSRTVLVALFWALGHLAAAVGLWALPGPWDDIASTLIIGTVALKAVR